MALISGDCKGQGDDNDGVEVVSSWAVLVRLDNGVSDNSEVEHSGSGEDKVTGVGSKNILDKYKN